VRHPVTPIPFTPIPFTPVPFTHILFTHEAAKEARGTDDEPMAPSHQ